MSSQPVSHKRSQHALNGQNDVERPPAKRQKTGENFSHELNDDVAAKLLLTIHQNGASSSSSQQNGSSRSLPAKSLSLTRHNSNSSSSSENQAEETVLKCMAQCGNFLAQKKNSEAVEVMQSAIGMKGVPARMMPGLLGMLGKALTKNNRRDDVLKAIGHLRAALSMQPLEPATHAQLLLFLSAALGQRGDPKDADEMIACTETGLKLLDISDEVRAKFYSNLGVAYTLRQKDGDLKKAVEALSAGLALNARETRPLLFFHLGDAYSAFKGMEGREAAIKNYKEAMACENAEPFMKAKCCERLSSIFLRSPVDLSRAIDCISEGVELGGQEIEPDYQALLHITLSKLLLSRNAEGDLMGAIRAVKRAVETKHNNPAVKAAAHVHYATVLMQRGASRDVSTAITQLRSALEIEHDNTELKAQALYNLAFLLTEKMSRENLAEALKSCTQALTLPFVSNHRRALIAKLSGDIQLRRNFKSDPAKALLQYELGANLEHEDAVLRAELFLAAGKIYVNFYQEKKDLSQLAVAIERYRAGVACKPNNFALRVKLVELLVQIYRERNQEGDLTAAIKVLADLIHYESKNAQKEEALIWCNTIHELLLMRNQNDDRQTALGYCEMALVHAEDLPIMKADFMNKLAKLLIERSQGGDLKRSIEMLTQAINLFGQNPLAVFSFCLLGQAYLKCNTPQDRVRAGKCFLEGVNRLQPQTLHLKGELVKGLLSILQDQPANKS
ncbi:MAG: hypothetical protein ACHQT8_02465 [Chlamydiales bacterium]